MDGVGDLCKYGANKKEDTNLKQLGIKGTNKDCILDLLCKVYDLT